MSLEERSTEINGRTFTYMPFGAAKARELLATLIQKLGPSWADALDGIKAVKSGVDLDAEVGPASLLALLAPLSGAAAGLVRGFAKEFSPAFYKMIMDTVCQRVKFTNDNGDLQFLDGNVREVMFATDLLTELKVVTWALSEQYADFFGQLAKVKDFAAKALATMGSNSSSPPASIGSSSESPQVSGSAIRS